MRTVSVENEDDLLQSVLDAADERLLKKGIPPVQNPGIDFGDILGNIDVTKISDKELGRKHFHAVQLYAYISYCVSHADVGTAYALDKKEKAYARAIISSRGSSADDRKADATNSPLHKVCSDVYLSISAEYKILKGLLHSVEKVIDAFSREMTRRRLIADQRRL